MPFMNLYIITKKEIILIIIEESSKLFTSKATLINSAKINDVYDIATIFAQTFS